MPEPAASARRFRHEGGLHAPLARQFLDRGLERRDHVGRDQGREQRQIQFELAAGHFVVARLDAYAERLQAGDDLQLHLPRATAAALEVAARVVGRRAGSIGRKQEELDLRGHEIAQSRGLGLIQQRAESAAAVARIELSVGLDDLADEPGAGNAGTLQDRERGGIGPEVHVRLDFPREALDRGSIEPLAIGKDGLDAARRHCDRLDGAGHVGELEFHLRYARIAEREQDPLHGPAIGCAAGRGLRDAVVTGVVVLGPVSGGVVVGAILWRVSGSVRHVVPPAWTWGAGAAISGHGR